MTLPVPPDEVLGPTGSRTGIGTLIMVMEDAFQADFKHSLLANLRELPEAHWDALLPGAGRTIADIVEHVARTKWLYEDYAFGSASLRADQPPIMPAGGVRSRPRSELMTWLVDGHNHFLDSVRALSDDAELQRPRLAHWGAPLPTRAIIHITINHDLYHSGEINHIRALLQESDRFA